MPAVYLRHVDGSSDDPDLDLDRGRRLHDSAQRLALTVRDRGCTADGCDRLGAWCQAHHEVPWSSGGITSVDNGRLLCASTTARRTPRRTTWPTYRAARCGSTVGRDERLG